MSDFAWRELKVGDIFRINTASILPNAFPSSRFYHHSLPAWDESGGPVIEPGLAIESNKTALKAPCVLVSKLNPRKPRVSVVENIPEHQNHCASTEFVCLEPAINSICLAFWRHFFSHKQFSNRLDRVAIGSTNSHKRYGPKELLSFRINVPPASEQEIIAQILDILDTQIQKTEAMITKLETIKEGLLHDLLSRGIGKNGQLRPSPEQAPELYQDSALGLIPRDWAVGSAHQDFVIDSGFTLGAHRRPQRNARPYLRVANVHRGRLDLSDIAYLEANDEEMAKKSLSKDDLLIVEGHANPGEIGRCAMATESVSGYTFQNHLFRLKAITLLPHFAFLWMNSDTVKKYWRKAASSSSGLYTINRTKLEAVPTAKPKNAEQLSISRLVKEHEDEIATATQELEKLKKLKVGISDDLLTGKVRVTPLLKDAV